MLRKAISVTCFCTLGALIASCSGAGSTQQSGSLDTPGTTALGAQGWDSIVLNNYNYADTELDSFGHFKTTPNGCHQDAAGALDVGTWNKIAVLVNRAIHTPALTTETQICFARSDNSKLFGNVDLMIPATPHAALVAEPWPSFWPFPTASTAPTPTITPTPTPTVTVSATPTPTITISPTPHSSGSATPSPSPSNPDVKRTILENNGSQICTTIQDKQLAMDLVDALDELAAIAYKEDCERVP